MKIDFLHTKDTHTRLILIFAGWSAGPEIAEEVSLPGWDVAVVHDFSEFELDVAFLDRYYTVYLFAWSFGVMAASRLLPAERITAAFAMNGTINPIDDLMGIPVDIFRGTLEGLSPKSLMKFRRRMMPDAASLENLNVHGNFIADEDSVDNLRHQLEVVYAHQHYPAAELPWVRAYLGSNDRIFPIENMRRSWREDADVQIVESDDYHYMDLRMVISSVISNPEEVSRKFTKAKSTYDTHAIAQYSAAMKLSDRLGQMNPRHDGVIVEIGCGTGLFTREYSRMITPRKGIFVDIVETGPFDIAEEEEYICADAEHWICEQPDAFCDAILSASAIQWFADIPRFLSECSRVLRDGGVLAISTFLPGNLEELDALRPSPLIYPTVEMLEREMRRHFSDVRVEADEIRVEFKSAREVLMHLKHTGVGGSAPGSSGGLTDMSHLRTLTYRPVYVTGRKSRGE